MELKNIKRNKNGLLTGVKHKFTEDGLIDWRGMIKPEYLVPNKQKTSDTDVTQLADKDLIILLGGLKELAQMRGFTDVKYNVVSPASNYVAATCSITWIPNYETEGREVTFSAIGDASPENTQSFARFFLGPIAENRSFVRCVRNFLKINIVGQEELGNAKLLTEEVPKKDPDTDPRYVLQSLMEKKGVTFENIKAKLLKEVDEGKWKFKKLDTLNGVYDIPKIKALELVGRLQKFKGKK